MSLSNNDFPENDETNDWRDFDNFEQYFGESIEENDIVIPWKHCFYKIFFNIRRLFYSPLKSVRRKEDLNLISQVSILLQTEQSTDKETINKCAQLISLHRHMENTSARKRLESWAKRIISIYLFVVLVILLMVGGLFDSWAVFRLNTEVIIVLLSTTTINIIGLGLIVLRGHFEQKKQERMEQKEIAETN